VGTVAPAFHSVEEGLTTKSSAAVFALVTRK
jgi:hypothetical protein